MISDELTSKYQFNYYDGGRKLYLKIDSLEYKILGYNYDFIDIDLSGQSASDIKTIMNIKIDDSHFLPIVVYEDFGYLSCQFSLTSKITEDGEIEIHIYNHCGRGESYGHTSEGFLALETNYNVELFYKINEKLNIEFKGIRIPEKKENN